MEKFEPKTLTFEQERLNDSYYELEILLVAKRRLLEKIEDLENDLYDIEFCISEVERTINYLEVEVYK